jgi:hypothetical protein
MPEPQPTASETTPEIRTDNEFLLAGNGNWIAPVRPIIVTNREQAYRLASWLIHMAVSLPHEDEDHPHSFSEIHEAIANL